MANFTYTLEKYHGTKSRHVCPNCSARREFVRYVDTSGNYLADDVGKCNRETKCGFHRKPKEYFADNPNFSKSDKSEIPKKRELQKLQPIKNPETKFDLIPFDFFAPTKRLPVTSEHLANLQIFQE